MRPESNTEQANARYSDIDVWPTIDAVEAMCDEQMAAIAAVRSAADAIATAAEAAAARLMRGGRIIYVGAGTSGRLAMLDGVELGPTYGWPGDRLVTLIAGGPAALMRSAEGAEDDAAAARDAVAAHGVGAGDVVIGVAASGRTPFTLAAIKAARAAGALTIAITNNPGAALLMTAEHALLADTGSEVVAGSTRMKAGTAQKAILNILSTAIMLRLGRVYRGLMVDMVVSNDKLLARAQGIVATLAGCDDAVAARALDDAGRDIKTAVLIAMGQPGAVASALLAAHGGRLREAIAALDR